MKLEYSKINYFGDTSMKIMLDRKLGGKCTIGRLV